MQASFHHTLPAISVVLTTDIAIITGEPEMAVIFSSDSSYNSKVTHIFNNENEDISQYIKS